MKKISGLLLIIVCATSCIPSYNVIPKSHNYLQNLNFTIDKVSETTTITHGTGILFPSPGYKFVMVYVTLKNNLDYSQEVDFDNFILINPRTQTRYRVERVMRPTMVGIDAKFDPSVREGDVIRRRLVFLYPENEKPQLLLVMSKIIEIEYRN